MPLSRLSRRDLMWMVVLLVLLMLVWVVDGDPADAGAPPAEGIDVVYVTVGTGYADALGVGPGAAAENAPNLLVPTNPPIPATTEAELIRLDPKKVVIVGGTAVISPAMQTAIEDVVPGAIVERLAGANRYETNTVFTSSLYPVEGWASIPSTAFDSGYSPDLVVKTSNSAYNDTSGLLVASIQLPHGATILEFQAWFYDDVGGDGSVVTARLYRKEPGVSTVEMAVVDSTGATGAFTASETTIFHGDDGVTEPVDNSVYSYTVEVSGADQVLQAIRQVAVRYRLGATP